MRFICLLAVTCFSVLNPTMAFATPSGTTPRIQWLRSGQSDVLKISLLDQLSDKHKKLIRSGFSTFSVLDLTVLGDTTSTKVSCTIKYDTWEEIFEVIRVGDSVKTRLFKDFSLYADGCLSVSLSGTAMARRLAEEGGELVVTLHIDQISTAKAKDIKNWLIQKQSGVMQGLFSHMLGDLTSTKKIQQRISVAPRARRSRGE